MRYFLTIMAMLIGINHAQASDEIYIVRDVKVDVKAESAVAAEHKALLEARLKAFKMLIERLVPEDERAGLGNLSADKIEDLVDYFEVSSQKNSKVRYIANMTFFFDGAAVQSYLGGRTVTSVQSAKQSVVIIPVFIDQGGINLWGEQNPWLGAWAKREKLSAVTPIVVPFGDLKDISTVDGKQIVGGEISGLRELARRYGSSGVIIATMRRDSANPNSPMTFEATLVNLDGQSVPLSQVRQNTTQGAPALQFDQAIDQIVKQLEGQARVESKFIQPAGDNQLLARIPLDNQQSWTMIQQAIKASGEVTLLTVKGLTRRQATVLLTYRGTPVTLGSALGARGLQLEQLDGQTWVIRSTIPKTSTPY
jgi:hypothetical protein